MQVFVEDTRGIINTSRLAYVIRNMFPGSLGLTITIYEDENENYYVYYETNVARMSIDPNLFVTKVKFTPNINEQWKKVGTIGLSDVSINTILSMKRMRRLRPRGK